MNTNRHFLDYYTRRRTGLDPRAFRYHRIDGHAVRPLTATERLLETRADTGYRDLWTPGPWMVEFAVGADNRPLYWLEGERAPYPWGDRQQEANRHLIEGALGCYEGVCAALAFLETPAEERSETDVALLVDFLRARRDAAEGR